MPRSLSDTQVLKAKPKSIMDIAKLLQQKSKETNERKQSATNTTKPATPNQSNNWSDTKAALISSAKLQTPTITLQAKDSSESAIHVHTKPVQDTMVDLQALASPTGPSLTETTSRLNSILIHSAVDFTYSNVIDQMATEGLNKETYTQISNANDLSSNSIDSVAGSTTNNDRVDVTTNISQVSSQTSEVISSYEVDTQNHDASEQHAPKVVACEETVNMADAIMTTPEVSSAFQREEPFSLSEAVNVNVNIAQAQNYAQPLSQRFPNWSSNVIADKQSSDGQILNRAFESFPGGTEILDISVVFSKSGEVCQVSPSAEPIAGVSLFKSTEELSVAGTVSASCLSKAVKVDGLSEMSADVQSSITLKDPVLVQNYILEEEKRTEAEKLPEEQLDPIQRLFLHKIREYSTKSQASAGPVDAGADYEKAFSEELSKLQRLYGGGDLTSFPEFTFSEPVLDENGSK
ncbi:uncharacterized protein si:dkey-22n8.3 isoform X2 [Danio aesculapii]|uniref:uncharacterized protein si:dkey-22n8.3 isoform X2 n=1 Tax=Danio aesculapii TaxID=1142201 RepID=UPI0024BFD6A9|nr:uncharacterized protein si:dkey-22n8.3 isoform X2 [Danio aesculapii]